MSETNPLPNTEDIADAPKAAPETTAAGSKPEERIAALEAEISKCKDQLLRAMAETENVRRRAQKEREDTARFAVQGFAKDVLPVADNLRRALEAIPSEARETDEMLKTLAVGVEATERQLAAAFERHGVKRSDPTGEPFDPNFHQVMFEIENTGKPAGTIVQVLQAGYTLNGRLLREATVGVAKAGAPEHVDTQA